MSEEEKKANRRWWIVMVAFTALLVFLNYKNLPSLLAELAAQGLTLVTWVLWIKGCMDIYAFFAARRQLSEWGYINLGGALCCSLLLWLIHDAKEVLGVLYFAAAAAAVITIVFHPGKKR